MQSFSCSQAKLFSPFFANPLPEMRLISDCLVACSATLESRVEMPLFEFDERALESEDSRSNLVKKCTQQQKQKMIGSDSLEHMHRRLEAG